ncbi:MAG: 30S ribosomal protein S4 [Nanoarchaeota archaeon]|nr:30S ribosomal protein S4 [Nanoarchaeota archaeon]
MGDPKKTRKKYETPPHPWKKDRIEEERVLVREYGMSNKKEVYKMRSMLKNFKDQAKNLIALKTAQGEKEKKQILIKLNKLGLMAESSTVDPILDLTLRDVLERRLQTQVYKKNLAKTMKQARQFIVHGHITIGPKRMTSPSYLVSTEEETQLNFAQSSKINNIDHPERFVKEDAEKKAAKEKKKEANRARKGKDFNKRRQQNTRGKKNVR